MLWVKLLQYWHQYKVTQPSSFIFTSLSMRVSHQNQSHVMSSPISLITISLGATLKSSLQLDRNKLDKLKAFVEQKSHQINRSRNIFVVVDNVNIKVSGTFEMCNIWIFNSLFDCHRQQYDYDRRHLEQDQSGGLTERTAFVTRQSGRQSLNCVKKL